MPGGPNGIIDCESCRNLIFPKVAEELHQLRNENRELRRVDEENKQLRKEVEELRKKKSSWLGILAR